MRHFFIAQTAAIDFRAQFGIFLRIGFAGFGLLFGIECGYVQNILIAQIHYHRFHHSCRTVGAFAVADADSLMIDVSSMLCRQTRIHRNAAVTVCCMASRTNRCGNLFAFFHVCFGRCGNRTGSQNKIPIKSIVSWSAPDYSIG